MDKRWIGILLILIAGLGCMYLIVMNSNTVGNAVDVISDVTVAIPPGLITSEDGSHFCVLYNKETNETMRVKCIDEGTNYIKEYDKKLNSLKNDGNIKISRNITNKTLSLIDYENLSSTDKKDMGFASFDKCNHTFTVQLEHFTNKTSEEKYLNYIIDNMKFDFKQNKA